MHINPTTGLILPGRFCPSPNCDERPTEALLELIVIHNISLPAGEFGGHQVEHFFCNRLAPSSHASFAELEQLKVSCHLFIRRTGEIIQFVPFHRRAWHAGISEYREKTHCNDFSIGIELEGCDDIPYDEAQYQCLSAVIKTLLNAYASLDRQHIVGHDSIAPGRKTDPGPSFDWDYIKKLINHPAHA